MNRLLSWVVQQKQKIPFVAGVLVAVFGLVAVGDLNTSKVSAADCDNNAIIYCGFSSPSNFINLTRANDSKNGHHDLQAVYSAYGLNAGDYDRFASSARQGQSYKDGRIVVDGQTVVTGAKSIGRQAAAQGPGYFTQNIAGKNYYGNYNTTVFKSGSIPVTVLFNSNGEVQFAVLNSCGNPTNGTNVKPSYSCDMLNKTAVAGKANTYKFTASASAGNNASIARLVYDFGDGSPSVTTTSPGEAVEHTYKKGGSYTAKVTVYVKLPGNQEKAVVGGNCQTVITVSIPFYQCIQLAGAILDQSKYSYRFTVTSRSGNGATLKSADFNFGDGQTEQGVKPLNATTVSVEHTYAAAGTYSASAVLYYDIDGQEVTAPTCKAVVTPTTPPTPECKPGVPVGDARCTPCEYDANLPSDSPQCVPPVLPQTGAGSTIAIGTAVAVGGFLIYRQILFRKHRAAFVAAELGTSALPLGQPLDDNAPLAGTPLEPKRRSFRRPRLF
jgi:hypothetical protein